MTPPGKRLPHKDRGKGTYILDRKVRDVGRIKRASGTDDVKMFRSLNQMIDGLEAKGRLDILVAIRDGTLSPLLVWSHYRTGDLDRLPKPEALVPLGEAWEDWNKHRTCGVFDRASKAQALKRLQRESRVSATVAELPTILGKLRLTLEREKKAVAFNHTKRAVQAFLRDRYSSSSAIYGQVRAHRDLPVTPKQHKGWLSVKGVLALCNTLDDEMKTAVWSLCSTGMRPKEYFATPWERRTYCVHIPYGKTAAAERDIPDLGMVDRPSMTYSAFMQRLRRKTGKRGVRPYDFRRTFMEWMTDAEIDARRRRIYFGHEVPEVTELYRQKPTLEQLRNDAEIMKSWLKKQREAALKLVQEAK